VTASAENAHPVMPPVAPLRVVGIGASAGGLASYEKFFRHLPPKTGAAYVLVMHLHPEHESALTEILQGTTTMPVVQAQDRMAVIPDHVYVIPPNCDMTLSGGHLRLTVPALPRGRRMPIDTFLQSLAQDCGANAVGIILSGTGNDGTIGLGAILAAGGLTLVEEPSTAGYDGMPTSAIRAGYAVYVLPSEQMPAALLDAAGSEAAKSVRAANREDALNRLLVQVRSATGHDFSLYKKTTIGRRVERRMAQLGVADVEAYAAYISEHFEEPGVLFKELLINVTSFFRDPDAFAVLKAALPQLLTGKPDDYVFRVWIVGCCTGEEAYSIAILLREVMDETHHPVRVQIYATDLNDDSIVIAREGLFPRTIASDMNAERLRRNFVEVESGYRIKKEIRQMVVFAVQDVVMDPPFTKLDLLCCRNLMIYLESELQDRLIEKFRYSLRAGGILMLSPSESAGNHQDLFAPLDGKWKIYWATDHSGTPRPNIAAVRRWSPERGEQHRFGEALERPSFEDVTEAALLRLYAPASVVVNAGGDMIFVYGDTGKYLRPAPGQPTNNVLRMAREGLASELQAALSACATRGTVTLGRVVTVRADEETQHVSLSVRPLSDQDGDQRMFMISFQEVSEPAAAAAAADRDTDAAMEGWRIQELEREIGATRKELQTTINALQSTIGELQSTNEELQSTNEELETAKEELQSVNEELVTVNAELQQKVDLLSDTQNDLQNLLDNVGIGTIFVDRQLRIRRFNRDATRIFRLLPADLGRPLTDIKNDLEGFDIFKTSSMVLESLVPVTQASRAGGMWYLVRVQAYRTLDNVIAGLVVSLADISERVHAESAEHAARQLADSIIDTLREPLLILDEGLRLVKASRAYYDLFGTTADATVGRSIFELGGGIWDLPALRQLLEILLPRDQSFDGYSIEHELPGKGRCRLILNARKVVNGSAQPPLILLALEVQPVA
jgi:two-component system, chemotaxis family, CheB/CheR fusion protein